MEFFMTIVVITHGFKPLTIFIENFVLGAMVVLDLPLKTSGLLMTSSKLISCRMLKYKIITLENVGKN